MKHQDFHKMVCDIRKQEIAVLRAQLEKTESKRIDFADNDTRVVISLWSDGWDGRPMDFKVCYVEIAHGIVYLGGHDAEQNYEDEENWMGIEAINAVPGQISFILDNLED